MGIRSKFPPSELLIIFSLWGSFEMSAESTVTKAARRAQADIQTAVEQARLAYTFVPSSYTFSCLSACLAVEKTIEVLRDHMSDHFETSNPD